MGALALYVLAALAFTWPLARRFTTHLPGDGIDDPSLAWNLWWVQDRLIDQLNPDIFHVGWMFHPIEINLAFYTLTPLNALLNAPLSQSFSPIAAANLTLLSSYVLGGYGAFLLIRAVWQRPLRTVPAGAAWGIAWLGGFFFAFAAPKLFYASLGQFNIAGSHWIPFFALYMWRMCTWAAPEPTGAKRLRPLLAAGALAGLFLALQAWTELTYASFLVILSLFAFIWASIAWCMRRPEQGWESWRGLTLGFATTAGVSLIGVLPFLAAMLPDLRREGDFFASGGGFADIFSADLAGFLLPTRLHPLLGQWAASFPFPNDKGQQIFLGYSLMILLLLGTAGALRSHDRRTRGAAGFWLGALLLAFLLALGPHVRWMGEPLPLPGPFALVSQLPFFSGNRYPSRYSVLLILAAALLGAYGLLWLLHRMQATRPTKTGGWVPAVLIIGFGALFAFEQAATPLPLNDFRTPEIYARLAAEPGDFAVLELPTGWRNGARVMGRSDELIMMQQWYQTTHEKRRLGGNTSRNPPYKFQYFSEDPFLADLIALMNADRDHLAPVLEERFDAIAARTETRAAELLAFLDVHYVTVHVEHTPSLLLRLVDEAMPLQAVETWQGRDWMGRESAIRLYRVTADAPQQMNIDLRQPDQHHHLGAGWSAQATDGGRYATRSAPVLLLDWPTQAARLTLSYAEAVTVRYGLNGHDLGEFAGSTHVLEIPDTAATTIAHEPVDRLALHIQSPPRPVNTLVTAPSVIGDTGAQLQAEAALVVASAGEEVGDFARITVNGVNYAGDQRGYHLAAVSAEGRVLETAHFDTFSEGQADSMAAWLLQWPEGTIIAGAVADEASRNLTLEAVQALNAVGVQGDLRDKFRWSHAFIGVAGAAPGTALEALDLLQPARVWVGTPVTTPEIYAQLHTVALERLQP